MQSAGRADWFQSDPGTETEKSGSSVSRALSQPRVSTVCIPAGVIAASMLVAADATVRGGFIYVQAGDHFAGALALYSVAGTLLGLIASLVAVLEWWLVGRWVESRGRRLRLLRPAFYGLVAAVAAVDTARWTFSGESVAKTALATWGPVIFCAALGMATFVALAVLLRAVRGALSGKPLRWAPVAALLVLAGGFGMWVDLTQYVMLYQRVHTILELASAMSIASGCGLLLVAAARSERRMVPVLHAVSLALVLWTGATVAAPGVRLWIDEKLRHVWLEEAYVGRMLWRFQIAEAFLSDPEGWRGLAESRIKRLRARYNLSDVSLAPRFKQALNEPPEIWSQLQSLRRGQQRYDVVVYYVDTLRHDVASDPGSMPNLVKFTDSGLSFSRAYATGSDTLRSLPGITGGNYDTGVTRPNDLLRVAKRADYESVLVIAKSAREFLNKLRPEFRFDRSLPIQDYPEAMQVWGYGAQQPTAREVVDAGLAVLREKRTRPVFLWLFNFDQHNWRELDAPYVDEAVKRYGIVDDPALLPYRYRAVARSVDEQFGRLIAGLEADKRMNRTIVLFVSDHGEALGRDGFWVHSVFLWEPLMRVPLVLKAPHLPARRIDDKVSLVDVAPTLARYMDPMASMQGYQGEDLLGYLLPNRPARRHPLYMQAAAKDVLVRVGLVDPVEDYKLVLSLEASYPELYDLRARDPDAATVTRSQPDRTLKALRSLVRSPVFPRSAEDFEVRDTKEQKALAAGKQLSSDALD